MNPLEILWHVLVSCGQISFLALGVIASARLKGWALILQAITPSAKKEVWPRETRHVLQPVLIIEILISARRVNWSDQAKRKTMLCFANFIIANITSRWWFAEIVPRKLYPLYGMCGCICLRVYTKISIYACECILYVYGYKFMSACIMYICVCAHMLTMCRH